MTEPFEHLRHGGDVWAAAAVAMMSTGCYAVSAVLQEQEASRQQAAERLVRRLLQRPRWWLAVLASVTAAGLHIVALALGPLSVVQPIGVLTLVLALPLGARWAGRTVSRAQWLAAVAVAAGLIAVLAVTPHRPHNLHPGLLGVPEVVGLGLVLVALLIAVSQRLPERGAPVVRATAAAVCFGFASGMTRVAAIGAAPFLVAGALAVAGAAAGFGLAQLAYRNGGLGAPLATVILVDPLVAVLIGVTVLGESVPTGIPRLVLGALGLAATSWGIWVLAHAGEARHDDGRM
jgi:drug/metabolite transporter (DMT)-like permease